MIRFAALSCSIVWFFAFSTGIVRGAEGSRAGGVVGGGRAAGVAALLGRSRPDELGVGGLGQDDLDLRTLPAQHPPDPRDGVIGGPDRQAGPIDTVRFGDPGPYVLHGPRVHEFLQEMHRAVFAHRPPGLLTVGEQFQDPPPHGIAASANSHLRCT